MRNSFLKNPITTERLCQVFLGLGGFTAAWWVFSFYVMISKDYYTPHPFKNPVDLLIPFFFVVLSICSICGFAWASWLLALPVGLFGVLELFAIFSSWSPVMLLVIWIGVMAAPAAIMFSILRCKRFNLPPPPPGQGLYSFLQASGLHAAARAACIMLVVAILTPLFGGCFLPAKDLVLGEWKNSAALVDQDAVVSAMEQQGYPVRVTTGKYTGRPIPGISAEDAERAASYLNTTKFRVHSLFGYRSLYGVFLFDEKKHLTTWGFLLKE